MEVWVGVDPDRFLYNRGGFVKCIIFTHIEFFSRKQFPYREADFLI